MENRGLNSRLKLSNPGTLRVSYNKLLYTVLMISNFLSMIFGIIYLFASGSGILWNICGCLVIASTLGSVCMIAIRLKNRVLDYLYLILLITSMLAIPLLNTLSSSAVDDKWSRNIVPIILLLSLFVLGGIIFMIRFQNYHKNILPIENTALSQREGVLKKSFRKIAIVLLCIFLLTGIYIFFELLTRNKGGVLEVFIPEYSLFFGFAYLGTSILLFRLIKSGSSSILKPTVILAGLILFIVCSLPLMSVPYLLSDSERNYTDAFGTEWKNIVNDGSENNFMATPFSIPEYFFGTPSNSYSVKENILFYEGKEGVDKGVKLYFDAYTPPSDKDTLPGRNSVLIRIHGGGWTIGDKGAENYAQVNKYFASQGYMVFDIQYGLHKGKKPVEFVDVDENVLGDFNIDDMVRHIGIFTKYLALHGDEYHANLDSVFISGGSAGGQLTIASGLALSSGKYSNILDSRLKIKGIIPFYPANGLSQALGIGGANELTNPSALVDANSPPCLIYQGTLDGLVDPKISSDFRDTYIKAGNTKCALLSMPFGSHGSDYYYSGYYNQVFMYYMERFMYQFR